MDKVIVFDFDKTMINKDSILPFFLNCCKRYPYKYILIPLYICAKLLSKIGLISIRQEKEFGVRLLCPKSKEVIKDLSVKFASSLRLNNIYYDYYKKSKESGSNVIVASASFKVYLDILFPDTVVLGTTFLFDKETGLVRGLDEHPFGLEKKRLLLKKGINSVDVFFTDSKKDIPIVNMSKKTYWVKDGKIKTVYENIDI